MTAANVSTASRARSFYVAGGAIPPDSDSYIERRADQELQDALLRGEFCYVLTARQRGKSSLMVRAAMRLSQAGVTVGLADLTQIGRDLTRDQWYRGIATSIALPLDLLAPLEVFWREQSDISPLQRFTSAIDRVLLPAVNGPLVLFVDEIDLVRALEFSTDEFFAAVRAFANRRASDAASRRLTFCLLGAASPFDLIRDQRMTPFNIGRRIELEDFAPEEAVPLSGALSSDSLVAEVLLERILHWTHGHPFLTQQLCLTVAENPTLADVAGVDRLCTDLYLSQGARATQPHLAYIEKLLLSPRSVIGEAVDKRSGSPEREERDTEVAALLDLYGQTLEGKRVAADAANRHKSLLLISGIVRDTGDGLRVANRIYEQVFDRRWVRDVLPHAEVRRQRAAFRRGVIRALAVAVPTICVILAVAASIFYLMREAQRQLGRAEDYAYAAGMHIALEAWQQNDTPQAWKILNETAKPADGIDRCGFEWNYLKRLFQRQRFTLNGYKKLAFSVAYSGDGSRLYACGMDGTVRVMDTKSGAVLPGWQAHDSGELTIGFALSRRGDRAATATSTGTIKVWDTRTRSLLLTFETGVKDAAPIALSPDGRLLVHASGVRSQVLFRNAETCKEVHRLSLKGEVRLIAFSTDGTRVAICDRGPLGIFDTATGRQIAAGSNRLPDPTLGAAFTPDGRYLATGQQDGQIQLWDARTLRPQSKQISGNTSSVVSMAFSRDGLLLATAGWDNTARVWDTRTWRQSALYKGHPGRVNSVAFSPDGRWLASAGANDVRVWDRSQPPDDVATLNCGRPELADVAWSTNSKLLLFGPRGLCEVDEKTGRESGVLPTSPGAINSLRISPGGQFIAARRADEVLIWNAARRRLLQHIRPRYGVHIGDVRFLNDGETLAIGLVDGSVELWDIPSNRLVLHYPTTLCNGVPIAVNRIAVSRDRTRIAVGGGDPSSVVVWDLLDGRCIALLPLCHPNALNGLAFLADGRLLTGGWDRTVRVWPLPAEGPVHQAPETIRTPEKEFSAHADTLAGFALSPDGRTLATSSNGGEVKLWNTKTWYMLARFEGPQPGNTSVDSLSFSPDGRTLAARSGDSAVRLWRAEPTDDFR